jgi:hypothetical protein
VPLAAGPDGPPWWRQALAAADADPLPQQGGGNAVLRPPCHCPGPLGMGAIDRRVQMLEDFEADARRLRYLLHEL